MCDGVFRSFDRLKSLFSCSSFDSVFVFVLTVVEFGMLSMEEEEMGSIIGADWFEWDVGIVDGNTLPPLIFFRRIFAYQIIVLFYNT